ncbi:hypothetical protein RMSM_04684 [Rhodopirellula maiorica SM1]|uniref:Uncharacterized protein n=1 Tax=Rhodopirellula maiorica SM1 TaxID=1265738 RepID=M5RG75_9BACT|nr:hypothetical protein RMSM_04684 [Rhodopirellula maiorica SM1]
MLQQQIQEFGRVARLEHHSMRVRDGALARRRSARIGCEQTKKGWRLF